MYDLSISDELKKVCSNLVIGVINSGVTVEKGPSELWDLIDREYRELINSVTLEELSKVSGIRHLRATYKSIGKAPSRYRGSAEALIRRLLQGKGLYRVNNIVDINNYISIASKHSVGSYDVDAIKFPAEFRIGKPGEQYKGIGKNIINIEELPVFADAEGPYGSPTSDSEKAMIKSSTKNIMMLIISFSGMGGLEEHLRNAATLIEKFAKGKKILMSIVK